MGTNGAFKPRTSGLQHFVHLSVFVLLNACAVGSVSVSACLLFILNIIIFLKEHYSYWDKRTLSFIGLWLKTSSLTLSTIKDYTKVWKQFSKYWEIVQAQVGPLQEIMDNEKDPSSAAPLNPQLYIKQMPFLKYGTRRLRNLYQLVTPESDLALQYMFLSCLHTKLCMCTHSMAETMIYSEFFHQCPDLTDRGIHTEQMKNILLLGKTVEWVCKRKHHKSQFQSNKLRRLYDLYFQLFLWARYEAK